MPRVFPGLRDPLFWRLLAPFPEAQLGHIWKWRRPPLLPRSRPWRRQPARLPAAAPQIPRIPGAAGSLGQAGNFPQAGNVQLGAEAGSGPASVLTFGRLQEQVQAKLFESAYALVYGIIPTQ